MRISREMVNFFSEGEMLLKKKKVRDEKGAEREEAFVNAAVGWAI